MRSESPLATDNSRALSRAVPCRVLPLPGAASSSRSPRTPATAGPAPTAPAPAPPGAGEGDLGAVRREGGLIVFGVGRVRQIALRGAVRVHDVDLAVVIAVAAEGDPLAVGRERRL